MSEEIEAVVAARHRPARFGGSATGDMAAPGVRAGGSGGLYHCDACA